jgi:hypothetical protein
VPLRRYEPRGRGTKWDISPSFYDDGFTILSENINAVKIKVKDVQGYSK